MSVQPGDLVDIGAKLRQLLSSHDTASYLLAHSFAEVDPELEALAGQLRPTVDSTAALIYEFLERLERTSLFVETRAERLAARRPQ
jgi:hypothetical protein